MITFTKAKELIEYVSSLRAEEKSIGFTPTMGALHEGHFSLIRQSMEENDVSMCSIFVNPTQFNSAEDLDKYPRTLEIDSAGLEKVGCDILFAPTVEEIYPGGEDLYKLDIDLDGLDTMMEGAHRPGHFAGVVQVVKRLLDIAQCDRLYMGQKDFQQFTIVAHMIRTLDMSVDLRVCPIRREPNGLAMSSRNARLTAEQRDDASILSETLANAKQWIHTFSIEEIEKIAMQILTIPGFDPEYFSIVDGDTLKPVIDILKSDYIVACTAVWTGGVRLIDNMVLKKR